MRKFTKTMAAVLSLSMTLTMGTPVFAGRVGFGLGGFAKKFAKFRTICHIFAGFFQLAALLGYPDTILVKVIRSAFNICIHSLFHFVSVSVKSVILLANFLNYYIFLISRFLRCSIGCSVFAYSVRSRVKF